MFVRGVRAKRVFINSSFTSIFFLTPIVSFTQTTISLTNPLQATTVCQNTVIGFTGQSNDPNALFVKWVRLTNGVTTATGPVVATTPDGLGNFSYSFNYTAGVMLNSQTTHVFRFIFGPTEVDVDVPNIPPAFETSNSITITVNPNPTATLTALGGVNTVCQNGTSPTVNITGVVGIAPFTYTYRITDPLGNVGSNQTVVSDGAGLAQLTVPTNGTTGVYTYQLLQIQESSSTTCSSVSTANLTMTIVPLPTATITASSLTACVNTTAPTVTITGAGGTAPFTFTYREITNGMPGSNQVIVSNGAGVATFSATVSSAATRVYELVSVQESSATACANTQTASVTIVTNANPNVTGVDPALPAVCFGAPNFNVTFSGVTGGPDQYRIIWNGAALAAGFTNDGFQTYNTSTNTVTVNIPGTVTPSTTYSGTLRLLNSSTGCFLENGSSVTINPLPTATIGSSSSAVCVNGTAPTVTLTGIGGTAPYTFVYTVNGGANQTITSTVNTATITVPVTTAGTFTYQLVSVQESSATACVNAQTASTTVTVNPLPTATIGSSSSAVCVNGIAPTVTLTGIGGTAPYTFVYTVNGGANQTITSTVNTATITVPVTTAGTFTYQLVSVQESSATACVNAQTASITVTVNALPTVNITPGGTTTFCADGSVTLTSTTGNSYLWSTGATTQSINVSNQGNYSVTMTDGNGCTNSSSVTTVTVNPLPTATIARSTAAVCVNGIAPTVTLTGIGGTAPYTFVYTVNGGVNQTITSTVNTATITVPVTSAGTFTYQLVSVQESSATACVNVQTASTVVSVNPLPIATITPSGSTAFCAGGSVTLNANSGTGLSYAWTNGGTSNSRIYNTAGSYTVTVTDGNGCSNTSAPTVVSVNTLPLATITASSSTTFCAGSSVTLNANSGTGLSYAWTNGGTSNSRTYNTAGSYTVTVTDGNGCSNTSAPTVITVNPLPTATITPNGPLTFCAGNSVNLTASNAVSYLWSNGATTNTISNITNSGTFSVSITDANGCSNTAAPVVVTVNALPTLNITNPAPVCSPGTVNLTAAAITTGSSTGLQLSYWSNANATTALAAPSSVGTSGTYYIRAIETVNNCSVIRPVTVAILPQAAMVVNTPAAVCAPNTIDITAAAVTNGSTAGLTYTYFTDALGTVTLNNANAIAQSGTYYIKGTPTTGCSAVVPVQVIINPPPVLVVNNPTAVCAPSLIDLTRNEITAGSENNLRFNYFIDAALNAEIGNPAQINNSGTYYIRATSNVTGCRSSLPVTVTVNPIPSGQLQTPPVNFICENGTLTLTASGSANYQWLRNGQTIPGATTASYDAATAGTYTVRFISAQGCARQASENIVLELLSQPIVDFAVTNTCVGVSASFQNRSQTNNAGGINWLWEFGDGSSSNQFSTQYAYITPGVYQVRLTASNPSCAVSASKTMEYIVRTAARSVRYPDVETLRGVAVAVNARSNIGNQYLWSPVAGVNQPTIASPIITVNETTLYTVSITSDIGCVTTDTVLIKIIPGTDIFVPQGFTPNNDGQNDRLFPILVGMRQLNYFKVFNRWGNMIFSTNSATPAEGWNGVYLGAAQPTGAYTWIAEAVDLQGRVVRRTGTVMLLR